jgi:hypothetical protein
VITLESDTFNLLPYETECPWRGRVNALGAVSPQESSLDALGVGGNPGSRVWSRVNALGACMAASRSQVWDALGVGGKTLGAESGAA